MFKEWKSLLYKPLKIMDMLINMIVVGLTIFLIAYWKYIPEQVPRHWNAAGVIDDYADAGSYIMLLIMMYGFWIAHHLTKLITMFDWKENLFGEELVEKVSKEAETKAINTLFIMLWCCDLTVQLLFAYIIVCGVLVRNLGVWFLPAVFVVLTVDFVWFFVRMMKIKGECNR